MVIPVIEADDKDGAPHDEPTQSVLLQYYSRQELKNSSTPRMATLENNSSSNYMIKENPNGLISLNSTAKKKDDPDLGNGSNRDLP